MNICIITSWFPSKARPHLTTFVYNFAKYLGKCGVTVSVITVLRKGDDALSKHDFMTVYRINQKVPIFSILTLINKIKPDIIHVHAPNFFTSNAIIASKIFRIPIIATVHRAEVDKLVSPVLFHFRKLALRQFKKIIAVSSFSKLLAIKAGAEEEKISIVYNFCDEARFLPRDKYLIRKRLGLPIERKIILFVGNVIKRKGVYTLVRSLNILHYKSPKFLAIIIGKGEEQERLGSLIREYSLDDNVRLIGSCPADELPYYYNAADVFILPSTMEGHSVALLEAMASGVPIVASDIEGNRESIEDGINGVLFETGNDKMLAEKIITLLTNPELQMNMSKNNPKKYFERFSVMAHLENYQSVYESLIEENKKNSPKRNKVLLIDNQGLSHYTSYLARGISMYNDVIFYGISEEEYRVTGAAKEMKIKFYHIGEKLFNTRSILSMMFIRPLFWLYILLKALSLSKYDIVHIQGYLPMFFLFFPLLKLCNKRICWTLHDVNLRPSTEGLRGKVELLYVRILSQPSLLRNYSDTIIVHGLLLKNQLLSNGVNPEKVFVIPHFDYAYLLESSNYDNILDSTLSHTCNNGAEEYVLIFGRIKPYKGIDTFIKASKIVRNRTENKFTLVIAGKGDTSYFENLLTQNELQYVTICNRFVPNSEIPDLFNKAKFLVLPYSDGSQSGVISLAYTFSKAVIVSDVGSIAEFVDHGKTGFVFNAGNFKQLADYMEELIENDKKCIEMGRSANHKLLTEMSLEKCCRVINGAYKRN